LNRLQAALAVLLLSLAAVAPAAEPLAAVAPAATGPLWFQGAHLTPSAHALLQEMRAAAARGLDPADYGAEELLRAADGLPPTGATAAALEAQRLALDGAISTAARRFLRHLERGRVAPGDAGYRMPVPASATDDVAALRQLATSRDVASQLDRYEPPFVHFGLLKLALARYRALAQRTDLSALPPLPARKLEAGGTWPGVPALRRLLAALGDLDVSLAPAADAAASAVFDAPVVAALARFQARHGLAGDGVLGRDTLAALNVPMARRVSQLLWSMERARWLPHPAGPFVLVNVPQYRLFAFAGFEDREAAMTPLNVIVGQAFPDHNTPVFTAEMRYLVIRPYWDVPASIARKELLPALRKDAAYAAKHGFELVRGQRDDSPVVPVSNEALQELAQGKLRIRQRPGRENALGAIKFMLPNPYNVYLHSTPAQALFARTRRAFSHGCVRVEDPVALARFVLRGEATWTAERVAQEMQAEGGPLRVTLRQPVQVMMIYATALAAEDGRVLFFDDVYGHDQRLAELLRRPR
jgi:murein L,D-transpeptidase YcbB/YkuD